MDSFLVWLGAAAVLLFGLWLVDKKLLGGGCNCGSAETTPSVKLDPVVAAAQPSPGAGDACGGYV